MTNPFSLESVRRALERLPSLSSQGIRELQERAEKNGLVELVQECEAELRRRPIEYDASRAEADKRDSAAMRDKPLAAAVRYAFESARPASPAETLILRWIHQHPGTTHRDAQDHYGKGDLSLVIGHLVYDRYGCFRHLLAPGEDQSSILIDKDRSGPSVSYRLKPEVAEVLRQLEVI